MLFLLGLVWHCFKKVLCTFKAKKHLFKKKKIVFGNIVWRVLLQEENSAFLEKLENLASSFSFYKEETTPKMPYKFFSSGI